MKGLKQQQGMTMIGGLVTLVLLAVVALAGLQLFPLYYDYFTVKKIMDTSVEEMGGEYGGRAKLKQSLSSQLSMNGIDYLKADDFTLSQSRSGEPVLSLDYQESRKFFGNLYLTVSFNHSSK